MHTSQCQIAKNLNVVFGLLFLCLGCDDSSVEVSCALYTWSMFRPLNSRQFLRYAIRLAARVWCLALYHDAKQTVSIVQITWEKSSCVAVSFDSVARAQLVCKASIWSVEALSWRASPACPQSVHAAQAAHHSMLSSCCTPWSVVLL